MRKPIYLLITIALLFSACSASSLGTPHVAESLPEDSAPVFPLKEEPTSTPSNVVPAIIPKPVTLVPVVQQKQGTCSSLALERSLILAQWDRSVLGQSLIPYDPDLGIPLCKFEPIAVGKNDYNLISPEGNLLAYSMTQHDDLHDGRLHFVDLKTWENIPTSIEIDSWIAAMAFNPDGSRLAIALGMPEAGMMGWPKNFKLLLVDVDNRSILTETTLDMAIRLLSFTTGGESLMLYGVRHQESSGLNGEAHALLLDANSLEPQWDLKLEGVVDGQTRLYTSENTQVFEWWGPAAVLSSQMQVLFIVHAASDQLTTVDLLERSATTVEIRPKTGWFERLLAMFAGVAQAKVVDGTFKQAVLSPDGSKLYVLGRTTETYQDSNNETQFETTYAGLQVIDPASGTEITRVDTEAGSLAISRDGKRLFLHGWDEVLEWTEILDTASLEIDRRVSGRSIRPIVRQDREELLVSLSNRSGTQTTLAVFDPATLEQKAVWWVWGSAGLLMP